MRVAEPDPSGRLEPEALNHTDVMELSVYANETYRQAVLVARLDNLGKGSVRRGGAEHWPDAGASRRGRPAQGGNSARLRLTGSGARRE